MQGALLRAATAVNPDMNAYDYLYDCYSDLNNPTGLFIAQLFDEYQLALD